MKHDCERYDQDGLWLRFFEIAWRSRMEGRNVLPGREKIWADEAAALADAAVGVALNLLQEPMPATVYPWHLAPPGATHAAMDADGFAHWYMGGPALDSRRWIGHLTYQVLPHNIFPGDWKDSLEARP